MWRCFNGAAELLQRRVGDPPGPGADAAGFNGAAELLQRRVPVGERLEVHGGVASTEPLNCFSGEPEYYPDAPLGAVASTEPLNCFSGESRRRTTKRRRRSCFNGAAELLQRRGTGMESFVHEVIELQRSR